MFYINVTLLKSSIFFTFQNNVEIFLISNPQLMAVRIKAADEWSLKRENGGGNDSKEVTGTKAAQIEET